MKIYITRHSLTAWNEEKRLQGWKDSPLTKQGKEDALKLGEYVKTIHIDQVYSSSLLRAKSTARHIFKNENIIEDSRLKEMNFGDYDGEYIQDLKKKHDYFCLWHQPQLSFSLPNGETYEEVVFRLNDFILEKYNEDPQQTIFLYNTGASLRGCEADSPHKYTALGRGHHIWLWSRGFRSVDCRPDS